MYSAFTDKVERNCHFPAPGWNCKTHCQALQGFLDTSQVSLHKNNKINSPLFCSSAGSREMTVAFNFINERTVYDGCLSLLSWSILPEILDFQ
jgi:hypothetical protein